jgi:hypothetical protein
MYREEAYSTVSPYQKTERKKIKTICTIRTAHVQYTASGGETIKIQEAKYIECWPCPPFGILLN